MRIGIIGCGAISGIYFENLSSFEGVSVRGCADLDLLRANDTAERHGVRTMRVEEMLASPEIDMVLNLTVPRAHHEVSLRALKAGKHVYSEKPMAIRRDHAEELFALAEEKGLRVGCAPDTFLGASHQTCRKLMDDGAIGKPVGANMFMLCPGHESWHPAPQFYYESGGGPLFDMGPYYLTVLVSLLGSVASVVGMTQTTHAQRTITSRPRHGEVIEVETPTHIVNVLGLAGGGLAHLTTSFDVCASELPHIEIYGTEGTLSVPDPNGFGGTVRIRRAGDQEWSEVAHTHPYPDNSRGLGAWDMAQAIAEDRPHRANAEIAMHVVDVINAVHESAREGRRVEIASRPARPDPLPALDAATA